MDLHLWSVDEDEFVIAKDADDVRAVLREITCTPAGDHEWVIKMWPDDAAFTFVREEGNPASAETKTAREWCAQEGRGYFCASV